jgi:hypothetical protein
MSPGAATLGPDADDSNGVYVPFVGMVVDHNEATRVDSPFCVSVIGLVQWMQLSHSEFYLHACEAALGQTIFSVKGPSKALDGHTIEATPGLGRYFRAAHGAQRCSVQCVRRQPNKLRVPGPGRPAADRVVARAVLDVLGQIQRVDL